MKFKIFLYPRDIGIDNVPRIEQADKVVVCGRRRQEMVLIEAHVNPVLVFPALHRTFALNLVAGCMENDIAVLCTECRLYSRVRSQLTSPTHSPWLSQHPYHPYLKCRLVFQPTLSTRSLADSAAAKACSNIETSSL